MSDEPTINLLALTAEIVAAHAEHNRVSTGELSGLIASVHGALSGLDAVAAGSAAGTPEFPPATTIRKSLANPNHIISMIDGKPYAILRRHLTTHGITPVEYRARYRLPYDYPMTAPAYSEKRKTLAKAIGLGRKPRMKEEKAAKATPKRRARKPA